MSQLEVPLATIRPALQGVIPSPIATVSGDGIPNSTYLSIVWYIDDERIGLSNQFLGKTAANLRQSPLVALRVVDPTTMTEYELDATYLRSDSSGELFDSVRNHLEAVAAQSGMEEIFRLKAVEVLRVDRCAPAASISRSIGPMMQVSDLLSSLDVFVRRLSECRDLAELTRVALQSIEDLFGFRHSIILVADAEERSLFTVASNGYPKSGIGAEVPLNEGAIGVAAHRRQPVRLANVERMALAGARSTPPDPKEIALPGLAGARSVMATPLLLHDRMMGVLYLDSTEHGRFDTEAGRLVEVLAGHLAVSIALMEAGGLDPLSDRPRVNTTGPKRAATVAFHEHDGSVLVDGEYVIKGVPGRILFKLLTEHDASGRTNFTNREIRLDPAVELPAGNDNLEARLLTLRRRLADRDDPFRLERVGRGRLELTVDGPLALVRHDTSTGAS